MPDLPSGPDVAGDSAGLSDPEPELQAHPAPDAQAAPEPQSGPPAPPIAPPGPFASPTPPGHGRPGGRDGSWVGGLVLITIGLAFLVGQLLPNAGRFVPLLIGLSFLAVFLVTRNYGFLVPGGIVTGVGAGVVLAVEDQGRVGGGLFLVSLGIGFIGIYVVGALFRLHENHPWPLVPGGILATLGVITLAGTRYGDISRYAWPIVLIGLGALFVLRGLLRRPPT